MKNLYKWFLGFGLFGGVSIMISAIIFKYSLSNSVWLALVIWAAIASILLALPSFIDVITEKFDFSYNKTDGLTVKEEKNKK